jgi:U3 small nucleolar RNA-associated protein 19
MCPSSPRTAQSTIKKRKGDSNANEDGVLDPEVRDTFLETWLSVCDDVRWFFLRESG